MEDMLWEKLYGKKTLLEDMMNLKTTLVIFEISVKKETETHEKLYDSSKVSNSIEMNEPLKTLSQSFY